MIPLVWKIKLPIHKVRTSLTIPLVDHDDDDGGGGDNNYDNNEIGGSPLSLPIGVKKQKIKHIDEATTSLV